MNTVHRIMQRVCETSSVPPSDDTITIHHDTLQFILLDEIGETDGNQAGTEEHAVTTSASAALSSSSNSLSASSAVEQERGILENLNLHCTDHAPDPDCEGCQAQFDALLASVVQPYEEEIARLKQDYNRCFNRWQAAEQRAERAEAALKDNDHSAARMLEAYRMSNHEKPTTETLPNRLGIEGLRPVDPAVVREFTRVMTEEVIPKTVKAIRERQIAWNRIKDTPLTSWTPEYLEAKSDEAVFVEQLRGRGELTAADLIAKLRVDFETEREMHNAWRKRAEEAERESPAVVKCRNCAYPILRERQDCIALTGFNTFCEPEIGSGTDSHQEHADATRRSERAEEHVHNELRERTGATEGDAVSVSVHADQLPHDGTRVACHVEGCLNNHPCPKHELPTLNREDEAFIVRESIAIIESCFDGEYVTSYNGLTNALNDLRRLAGWWSSLVSLGNRTGTPLVRRAK